ncbi:MAG: DUF2147 domain-containing protein [Bernardetiaceae bacterium]|nr:DUF2147 domain-containing protein [Bernardetiaceae bacterium]
MIHKTNILWSLFLICTLAIFSISSAQAQNTGDVIVGNWQPSNKESVIQVYKGKAANGEDPNKYYGKIVWLKEPNDAKGNPKTDPNNPDASLKDRPRKGMVIMRDLEFTGTDKKKTWGNGKIYDPNNGSDYSFEASMPKNDNLLDGRGYIGISAIGRTDTWKRLERKK